MNSNTHVCFQDLKSRGRVDAIYHADKSIRDMVADEKQTTSDDQIFRSLKVNLTNFRPTFF